MAHVTNDRDVHADVTRYFDAVIAGEGDAPKTLAPVELPLRERNEADQPPSQEWYSLALVRVEADVKGTYGALGTLRRVESRHPDGRSLAPQAAIDSVTGLSGRRGFTGRLTRSIALSETDSVALFAIDGMKAIYMNYGQSTADEVRWGFARFLEAVTQADQYLAQIDDERFGVILPGMAPKEARRWATDALQLFAGLTVSPAGRGSELTASAGIARAQRCAEWTMRQAELGLIMARSAGGMQAGYCRSNVRLSSGQSVEQAIERAAQQAVEQANEKANRRVS